MLSRRRVLAALVGSFLAVAAPAAPGAAASIEQGARAFIESLASEAVNALTTGRSAPREKRIKRFRRMFNESFAVKGIAKWILGRYWRKATPAERKEYLKLFEDWIVWSYVDRFDQYAGQTLAVVRSVALDDRTAIVYSRILPPGSTGRRIRVDWRVGKAKDGSYKITDVMVEGTSMSQTMLSDFGSIIRRNGGHVEGLLKVLRKKVAAVKASMRQ